jgi:transcriptional regulator with XRE-family HTH domain
MISVKKLIQMLDDKRQGRGLDHKQFAEKARITEHRWRDFRGDRRAPTFEELARLASVADLSVQLVDNHHAPFMRLTPKEAEAVMRMVMHFKRNGPKLPSIFLSAAEKIEAELNNTPS